MLTKKVKFKDYNDVACEEELYFNLTKTEMMDMLDLQPRLEAWSAKVPSDPTQLEIDQIKELLDIIKILIEKSYGQRTLDGKHFRKNPEMFKDFKESAAYDAFLYELFGDPEQALVFMTGILPSDIAAQAFNETQTTKPAIANLPETSEDSQVEFANEHVAVDKEVPAYIREDREPTPAELQAMSKEEMLEAFRRKNNPS